VSLAFPLVLVVVLLANALKVVPEYERGVVFRLGRIAGVRGPGLIILIPGIERMVRVSLRTVAGDVPPQDIVTRDNVTIKVSAVLYCNVNDPQKAIIGVNDYYYATGQLAQTTLRSVLGQHELDEILAAQDKLNQTIRSALEEQATGWGVHVSRVEIKNIDLPPEMQRAMAKQAEAERERRAKVIHAEGEMQASQKLAEAATALAAAPSAMQLRYLQTLTEIAVEKNSTIIFPVPIELLELIKVKKTT
jgi:regulator of protease activity HflC (stomatin/prohibitin superfamily)